MEVSSITCLAELGMNEDDPLFFHQRPVNYLEGLGSESTASLFYEAESSQARANMPFRKPENKMPCQGPKRLRTDPYDHILAERKRREKINQRFIALSALVPGLKKMDKASVLGDAIKYMKQLQEKVKILEEQNKKKSMESLIFVKKHNADGENSCPIITEQLPKIEARFCNKDVLIIIHCQKRKGILEKSVAEIEKQHLSVVNSCVMTFGDSTLNITILALKDEEFTMNMMELVKNLQDALEKFV